MFQVPGVNKERHFGQRLHEEFGDDTDPRDRRLHVPRGVRSRQPYHQGRRCRQHCVRHGR